MTISWTLGAILVLIVVGIVAFLASRNNPTW